MTSAVFAARTRAERVRVAVGADTIAVAGLALVVGALALLTWGTWGDLDSDTGYANPAKPAAICVSKM